MLQPTVSPSSPRASVSHHDGEFRTRARHDDAVVIEYYFLNSSPKICSLTRRRGRFVSVS